MAEQAKEAHGPEMRRLLDRFYGDPDPKKRVQNFSMTPGPRFKDATPEEIAKMINDALDDVESGNAREVGIDD
jgi:hypothetical protein